MTKMQSNDQRQLQYEEQWKRQFSASWVGRYEGLLRVLERHMTHDQFLRTVRDLSHYKDLADDTLTDKDAVVALAYLNIKEDSPWFAIETLQSACGVDFQDLWEAVKVLADDVHYVEIDTAPKLLQALREDKRMTEAEYTRTRQVLSYMPQDLVEDPIDAPEPKGANICRVLYSQKIVGTAIHLGLDVNIEKVITHYIGEPDGQCDVAEDAIANVADELQEADFRVPKTREERIAELEDTYDVELRDDLGSLSIRSIRAALELQKTGQLNIDEKWHQLTVEELQDAGVMDEYTLENPVANEV